MDIIFLIYWFFTILYLLFNIGTIKTLNKYWVLFIYIVGMIGFILFAQGQVIYQVSNIFIIFNIVNTIGFFASKSLISIIFFSIIILMQLFLQRMFQCIKSCSACFQLNDKFADAVKGRQNDSERIYEYAKMDYAENISKILFIANIVSATILCINIIVILIVGKINSVKIILLAYSVFQIPILLIAAMIIIPIIKKYKIYFFTRYYQMGERVRKS